MTAQQLKRLAVALVVLVFLWGLVEIFAGRTDRIESTMLASAIDTQTVATVEIHGPDGVVRLERGDEGWTVNGFEASAAEITALFDALSDSLSAELVARNPASHGRMEVDSARGKRVVVSNDGDTLADLVFGKQGRGSQQIYVRPRGDERVYLLESEFARFVRREVTDWRDKRIVALEPDSVARFVVQREGARYALARDSTGWRFEDGAEADSAGVTRVLDAFTPLTAQGVAFASPAQADSADFTRPDRRLILLDAADDTLAALLFDSTSTGFWVRHAGGGTIYHLLRWKVDDIAPADSTLRPSGEE